MASGPVGGGIARSRSIWRFLSIDPEIYPLVGVLAASFGMAGYTLGRKASVPNSENNVKLAKHETFPWHAKGSNNGEQDANYKYKYHKFGDPTQEVVKAPSADISHDLKVEVPKEVGQKVKEKFEGNS